MMSLRRRVVRGVVGGLVATAVMSAQMVARPSTDRIGTPPPQRIADFLLPHATARERRVAAAVIHAGIGGASGLLYRVALNRGHGGIISGAIFGVAIWAVGYQLLVPMLGVLPPANRDRPARRAALLEAHLVYGTALGALS
jgi:uncharacterized membrane protein YagU involved in acid resistance